MPRIQGLSESGVLTGSQIVKSAPGYVFSVTLSWTGAAAGNKVYLRDGLDASAPAEICFVLDSANGTYHFSWPNGKEFATGIFYDEGVPANAFLEMTYK